jgi:hypothetical protein
MSYTKQKDLRYLGSSMSPVAPSVMFCSSSSCTCSWSSKLSNLTRGPVFLSDKAAKQCCGSGSGIRDWVLFDPWIRDPESGMGRKSASGSGMNKPDHIFKSLETIYFYFFGVKILKFFDEDPGSGMEKSRIRDPG